MSSRIDRCFAQLATQQQKGLVIYITAGDPNAELSQSLLHRLPQAGADIIELGMPFSDPMADGPAIQAANQRALKGGASLIRTLDMVKAFRQDNDTTPIVLMGYYNPIHQYGSQRFVEDAKAAGVDGLIIVDLPPEEDSELCHPARTVGIDWIRLLTPTTDDKRLPKVLTNSSGFVYYVSMTGITGSASVQSDAVANAIKDIRPHTDLPIAVGFGVKTPDDVAALRDHAQAVVVGSALINKLDEAVQQGKSNAEVIEHCCEFVSSLKAAT